MSVRNRRILWSCLGLTVLGAAFIVGANWWVIRGAQGGIVTDPAALPVNDVALVLGTSRYVGGKYRNPFFERRMDAAAQLYHLGKARHFLVSGDNGRVDYDEPAWMRDALVARGVPASAVTLDSAGFRTLDSMNRAKVVFGLRRFTIVTDDFHQARSVFTARSLGLDVVGFPSAHVPLRWSVRTRTRELISRTAAFLEVYFLHTPPRFYGPPVEIRVAGN